MNELPDITFGGGQLVFTSVFLEYCIFCLPHDHTLRCATIPDEEGCAVGNIDPDHVLSGTPLAEFAIPLNMMSDRSTCGMDAPAWHRVEPGVASVAISIVAEPEAEDTLS